MAVIRITGRDRPAEEEGGADEEPEDLHAQDHVCEEGDEEAGCEEEERLGGFEGGFPGVEAVGGAVSGGC